MVSLAFGMFTRISDSGPHDPLVLSTLFRQRYLRYGIIQKVQKAHCGDIFDEKLWKEQEGHEV